MDQSDDWKLQGGEKFQKYQFLKRILQFVFSVSAFSFLLWYSFGFSILPHDESFSAFFSTFLFSLFSHTLERKYMFVLCNVILALVAKTSRASSPSSISVSDIDDESLEASNLSETKALPVSEDAPSLMAEEQEAEQEKKQQHCHEEVSAADKEQEDGEDIEASIAKEDEEEMGAGGSSGVMVATQDDEADDAAMAENDELSNADELNRRVEEFIRKMKEEIRIEAQRQLIAV